MYSTGIFVSSNGNQYTVYEVESGGVYRLDICERGAQFHTDFGGIAFSTYRRRKSYVYGDKALYRELSNLRLELQADATRSKMSSGWEDGVFKLKEMKEIGDGVYCETVYINGTKDSETFIKGKQVLTLQVLSVSADGYDMTPINLDLYDVTERGLKTDDNHGGRLYKSLSELRKEFDIDAIEEYDYVYVKDEADAKRKIAEIYNHKTGVKVGVDTETTGVDVMLYGKDHIVGIIVSVKDDQSWYFPFRHTNAPNLSMETMHELLEAIQYIQDNAVAHNKKFERNVFMKEGYDIAIKHDSMQLDIVQNPVIGRDIHSLKALEMNLFQKRFLELVDIFYNKADINFEVIDEELARIYACPDGDFTRKVFEEKWKMLPQYQRGIYAIETELADLKADQEYWGFRVDYDLFKKGEANCDYIIDKLEKMIFDMTKVEFKLNSSQVLGDILYNKMKCKVYVWTKKNAPSTGVAALKKLASIKRDKPLDVVQHDIKDSEGKIILKAKDLNAARYPLTLILQEYRKYIKLKSSFYSRISQRWIGKEEDNVVVYRHFDKVNQNGARSGRQSSPMHQLPKPIKASILSDSDDHYLLVTDYSQIELRLLFSMAGEKEMIELCKTPADIHRAIGSQITGTPMWAISQEERKKGKSRNFGVVYLMSGYGLAGNIYGASPTKEQVKECTESIEEFFHKFKRVTAFIANNEKEVKRTGKIHTLWGRVRLFPEIFNKDITKERMRSLIRQANNTPVQGTAADIMKLAENNINRSIKNKKFDRLIDTPQGKYPMMRVMISAHDEAVVSVHKSIPVEEALEIMRESMELKIEGFAPLFAMSSIVSNWEQGKDDHYEIPRELRDDLIAKWKETGKSAVDNYAQPVEESMRALINTYQEGELIGWLEELYKQSGDDAKKLAELARDPSLTHELISRFGASKAWQAENGKLTHLEQIDFAAAEYLKFRKGEGQETIAKHEEVYAEQEEEEAIEAEIRKLSDIDCYYDQDGNVVYYDEGEAEDEAEDVDFDENYDTMMAKIANEEHIYVWDLFDAVCVDCEELTIPQCDVLLQMLYKYHVSDGFSEVKLLYQDKLLDTGIRVEQIDKEEITNYIKGVVANANIQTRESV